MLPASKTDLDVMILHAIPRYSSRSLARPAFFSCGKGGPGANAPFRRYRDISKVVFERLSVNSAMHDITAYTIPWYSWYWASFQGRPRHHHFPWYPIILLNILWYFSTISELPRRPMISSIYHRIPRASTKLFDNPWYSSIYAVTFPTDWYSRRLHGIPRYPIIF